MEAYDAIILGAGAAGLFTAARASQRGKSVLVLEHNDHAGAKILISGGGRCNFTNLNTTAQNFLSANPDFARSALARFTPADFIALIEKHGIAYYEKTLGQLFCEGAGGARKIVRMLLDECAAGGADIRMDCTINSVSRGETFRVETSHGVFEARTLVIATGGLSIPKLGATDLAYRLAKQFNLALITPRPGLVPLTFGERDLAWMRAIAGVSAEIVARAGGAAFREAALFTHRGLSGPAILQASSYLTRGEALTIDWLAAHGEDTFVAEKRARPKAHLKAVLPFSARLAEAFAADLPAAPLGDLKDDALRAIARDLKARTLTPTGDEGYAKAEVTVGGVDTGALNQRTLEARTVPGLFVIGEAVDVTGWLGGYNFQWAWASAAAAAEAL